MCSSSANNIPLNNQVQTKKNYGGLALLTGSF